MKTLRQVLATMLLALVLSVSVLAGDMSCPPGDMGSGGSNSPVPGDIDTPSTRPGEMSGPTLMAVLQAILDSLGR